MCCDVRWTFIFKKTGETSMTIDELIARLEDYRVADAMRKVALRLDEAFQCSPHVRHVAGKLWTRSRLTG
jgi:hypothetical protein